MINKAENKIENKVKLRTTPDFFNFTDCAFGLTFPPGMWVKGWKFDGSCRARGPFNVDPDFLHSPRVHLTSSAMRRPAPISIEEGYFAKRHFRKVNIVRA